jgi:tRNA-dihydrouridine synthase 3
LILIEDPERAPNSIEADDENRKGVVNVVSTEAKLDLARRILKTERADEYSAWLDQDAKRMDKIYQQKKDATEEEKQENRAQFTDPPFRPSEKRKLYFGPETPVLAPLTTQGNLPFRRMCVEFGAQLTYSEMAMTLPMIQGQKAEWALLKAHESEISPPRYTPKSVVKGYDNSKDLKFGTQISANKPWQAAKGAEILSRLVPHLRVIDLNCGCPIELVCRTGAGSALLDAPSKLEKMIRGMNAVSGEIPITAKIRMGTRDGKPTALKTIERLVFGGYESRERLGAPGCAAITLHGRSRQQRYTKSADWTYIAECAALIQSYNEKKDDFTDTIREADARTQANTATGGTYFIGNGDCYSHIDYLDHLQNSRVDSVMVARGALIKPWIFEEIEKGQYIDKSATERLSYIEKFARYGLEAWGSDEVGVGQTRRFLLEWLSFAHRYIPVGILDHLPPSLQDRPPAYRGRDDLETLLASDNYLDWIKLR